MRTARWTAVLVFCLTIFGCSEPEPDGQQVFWETGCARCHEANGSGGSMGPPLVNLEQNWTAEALDRFLENPPAYMQTNARLQKWREKFFTPMPQLNIPPDRRRILIEFLLSKRK